MPLDFGWRVIRLARVSSRGAAQVAQVPGIGKGLLDPVEIFDRQDHELPLSVRRALGGLGALKGGDEGLHAAIAQAMVEGGDYVTPRFLREPFPDKPVLFFWALAGSLRAFGFTEAAARVPGLLFGLLGAVTTGLLAGTILGRRGGWLAGIFYATLSLPIGLMQMPVHDLALVPFTNGALLAFWLGGNSCGIARSSPTPVATKPLTAGSPTRRAICANALPTASSSPKPSACASTGNTLNNDK